jgi:hypothetical protein
VVVGYFYEERPMLEIAAELGVTESCVSQLRAEAVILLRDGLDAHLDPDTLPPGPRPDGRAAKRHAAYPRRHRGPLGGSRPPGRGAPPAAGAGGGAPGGTARGAPARRRQAGVSPWPGNGLAPVVSAA